MRLRKPWIWTMTRAGLVLSLLALVTASIVVGAASLSLFHKH